MPSRRRVAHAPAFALAIAFALLVGVQAGCPGGARNAGSDSGEAVIQFQCQVSDAEVWVNGRFLADALRRGISIAPGTHRIAVRHDRYHTFFAEVTVRKGERRVLEVRLAEILP
jgi:hypothetical protein